jgi:hypothetical protein
MKSNSIPICSSKGSYSEGHPCHSNQIKTTSSGYSNSWTGASSSNYNSAIRNIDEAMRKLPESTPYVRPEFIPYTQPSQFFIPEPKYINPINLPQKKKYSLRSSYR